MKKAKEEVKETTQEEVQQEVKMNENQDNNKEQNIVEELNKKILVLEDENKKLVEKVKLGQAELINYRVRKDEETANQLKYANEGLIKELIPVVDNFERAIGNEKEDAPEELKKYYSGVKMIYAGLTDTLKKFGVTEINRLGEIFDPNQEQALLVEQDDTREDEEVVEVLLKGYKLKDRVIRPASVKINQK